MEAEAAHLAEERDEMPDERLPEPPRQGEGGEAWHVLLPSERVRALERELSRLDAQADERRAEELAGLESELEETRSALSALEQAVAERREVLQAAERSADEARASRREAERAVEAARAEAAEAGSQLAALNRLVRGAAGTAEGAGPGLVEGITAEAGYEPALAAALGSRLTAAVVEDLAEGEQLLDRTEDRGGTALVSSRAHGRPAGQAPAPGATRLLTHVRPEQRVAKLADRLLGDVWVVDSLKSVSGSFRGVAVTRGGRLLDASTGELSQAPPGGGERLLEELGRREGIVAASERAATSEREARASVERAAEVIAAADGAREEAEVAVRAAGRELAEAAETAERLGWLLERRREAPGEGPDTVRRAELSADLRAERHLAERAERERADRVRSLATLRAGIEADRDLVRAAARTTAALEAALGAVEAQRDALAAELAAGAATGEETSSALRACAQEEAELRGRLKRGSDAVTTAEVTAQRARDAAEDVERELGELATRLGLEPEPSSEPLPEEERNSLEARVERLQRRREQLGPVNPLAAQEYEEAVAHVDELEAQRSDLEDALAELEGLIKETDKRIRQSFEETFEAAARNFEEVVQHLFPGGRGRLRLVRADQTPRSVVGGESPPGDEAGAPRRGRPRRREPGDGRGDRGHPGRKVREAPVAALGRREVARRAGLHVRRLPGRPCPFYILDEVEAALDDINIDRFLHLVAATPTGPSSSW